MYLCMYIVCMMAVFAGVQLCTWVCVLTSPELCALSWFTAVCWWEYLAMLISSSRSTAIS